jgi:transcriptional regulator with XRE-family HTH domain
MIKIKRIEPSLLRIWREGLGLTKKEIAILMKVSMCLYGKYEVRANMPNLHTFKRMADFFIKKEIEGATYEALLKDMLAKSKN